MSQDPVKVIEDSAFFNANWYRHTYPDVRQYAKSAAHHYVVYGAQMGRDPSPEFSSDGYLTRNPDVLQAGHNPLWHYELYGKYEGREPSPSALASPRPQNPLVKSLIDHSLSEPLPAPARQALMKTFRSKLKGKPHRFFSTFDHDDAGRFVSNLCAQHADELAARNTSVSVIMPSYNRAATLGRAIQSVLGQSHQNLELIIIDDGSTDFTADVVRGYRTDKRLIYHNIPHSGVSAARNLGLSKAKGEQIFYLDSDNLWTRDFVRLMLIALQVSGSRCGYAATQLHNHGGDVVGYRGEPFDWAYCIDGNYVDLNVFNHSREFVRDFGNFDETLRRMVDWDLILRYTRENQPVYCPFIGCLYSDDSQDETRISTSKPYIFERVVSHKNAFGYTSLAISMHDLRFSIALKVSAETTANLPASLAAMLTSYGHKVRIDDQTQWNARHPHEDEVVIILPGTDTYEPHPEQLNLRVGSSLQEQGQANIHGVIDEGQLDAEQIAASVLKQITTYLLGNPPQHS